MFVSLSATETGGGSSGGGGGVGMLGVACGSCSVVTTELAAAAALPIAL